MLKINKKLLHFKILAIETSCDETSAAVLEVTSDKRKIISIDILSNIVSSQVKLHSKYGGVYPELASREHVKNILPVVQSAIGIFNNQFPISNKISNSFKDIDYIAVTTSPGLIGSLLVGTETAKTLAYVLKKPVVLVNHLEGHIYANFVSAITNFQFPISNKIPNSKFKILNNFNKRSDPTTSTIPIFPLICLVVSGGHTSLVYMKDHLSYKIIGETLDDAAGEAYDKVACMLDLGYPGGPVIDAEASKCKVKSEKCKVAVESSKLFPRPLINKNNFDFSFSGLKTSVLYYLKKQKKPYSKKLIQNVCYEFQEAVVETLVTKTLKVAKKYKVKSVIISGGVAANSRLRDVFQLKVASLELPVELFLPEKKLCTDNAAMIGAAAAYKILAGDISNWYDISASADSKL